MFPLVLQEELHGSSAGEQAIDVAGSRVGLWSAIEQFVKMEGCELFDLEIPPARGGILRVFIRKQDNRESKVGTAYSGRSAVVRGVSLDDCANVCRRLNNFFKGDAQDVLSANLLDMIRSNWTLEVSSPGVNRKLSRPEHFAGAVGERVRIVLRSGESFEESDTPRLNGSGLNSSVCQRCQEVTGTLLEFDSSSAASSGTQISICQDKSRKFLRCRLAQIERARVEFDFENAVPASKKRKKR